MLLSLDPHLPTVLCGLIQEYAWPWPRTVSDEQGFYLLLLASACYDKGHLLDVCASDRVRLDLALCAATLLCEEDERFRDRVIPVRSGTPAAHGVSSWSWFGVAAAAAVAGVLLTLVGIAPAN